MNIPFMIKFIWWLYVAGKTQVYGCSSDKTAESIVRLPSVPDILPRPARSPSVLDVSGLPLIAIYTATLKFVSWLFSFFVSLYHLYWITTGGGEGGVYPVHVNVTDEPLYFVTFWPVNIVKAKLIQL